MAKVINSYGTEINYNAAVELMDDELREEVHADLAPLHRSGVFRGVRPPSRRALRRDLGDG